MPATDTSFNIDEHIKERLMKYAPEQLRGPIEDLITSGRATVHDFIDTHELLFLSKEELEETVKELQNAEPKQAAVMSQTTNLSSDLSHLKQQVDELNSTIQSSLSTLDTAQNLLNRLSIDKN
ncbi:hypothetical protein HY469_01770 [Candidatus Roizmanbacteria bacterium]|nr:hypothetical protein [Candidatus Roizmanbacteria bacterium]